MEMHGDRAPEKAMDIGAHVHTRCWFSYNTFALKKEWSRRRLSTSTQAHPALILAQVKAVSLSDRRFTLHNRLKY